MDYDGEQRKESEDAKDNTHISVKRSKDTKSLVVPRYGEGWSTH